MQAKKYCTCRKRQFCSGYIFWLFKIDSECLTDPCKCIVGRRGGCKVQESDIDITKHHQHKLVIVFDITKNNNTSKYLKPNFPSFKCNWVDIWTQKKWVFNIILLISHKKFVGSGPNDTCFSLALSAKENYFTLASLKKCVNNEDSVC